MVTLEYIWVSLFGYIHLIHTQPTSRTEKDLLSQLLTGYNPLARPVHNISHAVTVQSDLLLVSVEDLDERNQIFYTYGWMQLLWHDDFLTWDPEEWGGLKHLILPTKSVWVPDIVIRNSAQSCRGDIMDEDKVFRVVVDPNGTVDLWTSGEMKTSCSVDVTFFPLDDQICDIQVDSWTADESLVKLRNSSHTISQDFFQESVQWSIIDTEVETNLLDFGDGLMYANVIYKIYLRRKPLYYMYNIVLPSIILSLLALLIFLLPADSGEKVSLGITVLLSFTVFQLVIADNIPKTSDYMPLLAIYILCTMAMTTISLLCAVVSINIHHHDPSLQVPSWLQKLSQALSRLVCHKTAKAEPIMEIGDQQHFGNGHNLLRLQSAPSGLNEKTNRSGSVEIFDLLNQIQADLSFLKSSRKGDDVDASTKQQWMEVARIIDKILFRLFFVITLLLTVALFGIYPLSKPNKPKFNDDLLFSF